jgi:hypothetical protein
MWTVLTSESQETWFDAYLDQIIASEAPQLPAHEGSIGSTDWFWYSPVPGQYHLQVEGGTSKDRMFTRRLISNQIEAFGKIATPVSWNGNNREEVQGKALRLIRTNKVHVHDNMPDFISGTVIGDHGTYQPEIQRDPNQSPRSQNGLISGHCQCILPGGKIIMADGSTKAVEDMREGDRVLTASGGIGIVSHLHKNDYDGKAVLLQPTGSTEGIWVTSNHPIFDDQDNIREADSFVQGDLVYYPQATNQAGFYIDVLDYLNDSYGWDANTDRLRKMNKLWNIHPELVSGPFNKNASSMPASIHFDQRFARLAGLYMAEGNLVSTHTHEVRWTFDYEGREDHLVAEVQDILKYYGLKSWVEYKDHGTVVCCASWPLVQVFKGLFGTGARSKHIDARIMQAPQDAIKHFLNAWIDGDGNRGNMGVRDSIATASETLVNQLRYLLARTGRESVICHYPDNATALVPGGKDLYTIAWRTNGGKGQGKHYFENNRVIQALREPEYKQYSGPVYNIEVLDEHTYVMAPGIACHNCDWGAFMNTPRTRQWKQYQNAPCAHLMALWWLAQSMPLDTGEGNDNPAPNGQGDMSQFSPLKDNPIMNFAPNQPGANIPGLTPRPDTGTMQRTFGPDESEGFTAGPGNPEAALPQAPLEPIDVDPNGSVPGKKPPSPANPIQYPGGTYSSIKESADMFIEGEMVQAKNDDWGTMVGDPGYGGVGQPIQIPAGTIGEVRGVHPSTGMVEVLFNQGPFLQKGKMQAWGATAWYMPNEIQHRPDLRGSSPMIRRT